MVEPPHPIVAVQIQNPIVAVQIQNPLPVELVVPPHPRAARGTVEDLLVVPRCLLVTHLPTATAGA